MEEQQKTETSSASDKKNLIPLGRKRQDKYEVGDNPSRYLRIWGVIDSATGEKELRLTCRRCSFYGTYHSQAEVDAFKSLHIDERGFCKFEQKVMY